MDAQVNKKIPVIAPPYINTEFCFLSAYSLRREICFSDNPI